MIGKLIYITGLSGSGKTTIALALQEKIPNSVVLDGDIIRSTISKDLGYDRASKVENIRRNNELIKLLYNQGVTVIAAFMASIAEERDKVFEHCTNNIKVQLTTPLEVCKQRDPKGLYAKNPEHFSGVNFKYDFFESPDLEIDTSIHDVNLIVNQICK